MFVMMIQLAGLEQGTGTATSNQKSSFYLRYYVEACNKSRGPSTQLRGLATLKHRSGGEPLALAFDLICSAIEPNDKQRKGS